MGEAQGAYEVDKALHVMVAALSSVTRSDRIESGGFVLRSGGPIYGLPICSDSTHQHEDQNDNQYEP